MCVLFLAIEQRKDFPLVLAANRDEFYKRPTAMAAEWKDHPNVYAGRDLVGNGTWLGITRNGRFAALTNYRDPDQERGTVSRGALVADFLIGGESPAEYLRAISASNEIYTGFNLVVGEHKSGLLDVHYYSNRGGSVRKLEAGIYGLSNHLLDTEWPKVERGKAAIGKLLKLNEFSAPDYFGFLSDQTIASDENLPTTGVGIERERLLSPLFIETPIYGTRNSTLVTIDHSGKTLLNERVYV